ncbi:MAG: Acetyl esterase [Alphaproteobacteria bacterium MarineAlpha2_Bin1]|nr:MAG: Acetyl esterase [Alphaproteobacteria bacterium MarineAlpha2_Bin1]
MFKSPEEISEKIRDIGNRFNPDVVREIYEIYTPLLRKINNDHISIIRNLSYGRHERNILDIHYLKDTNPKNMPVVIYLHGGGFTGGNKNALPDEPDLIHGNIVNYFVNNGLIGINATYRLAPEHKYPSGAEDVSKIIKFVIENSEKFGIASGKIFLFGQSAGASHVASYLFNDSSKITEFDRLAGCILFSGAYDLNLINSNAIEQYYGKNKDSYYKMSSVNFTKKNCCPIFICTSEFDPPIFKKQGEMFYEKLHKEGKIVKYKIIPGHNHISQVIHLNTNDNSIGPDLVNFIKDIARN